MVRYHVSCELLYEEKGFIEKTKAGDSIMVKAVSLSSEVIQVDEPLRTRTQVAAEAEILHA